MLKFLKYFVQIKMPISRLVLGNFFFFNVVSYVPMRPEHHLKSSGSQSLLHR